MIRNISIETRCRVLIILLGLLIFLPFIGLVHLFDWDEINFAESAREMIITGDYSTVRINFIPFWEKPPLFIWLQVLSMKLFGINEFAARFPNTICGVLTLLALFEIGKFLRNYKFGLLWALAYAASVLPFLYFKSGIIDPWFNLFIFTALYFAFRHFDQKESRHQGVLNVILSAGILGLAVLTKGPVAILLFGITIGIFILIQRKIKILKWKDVLMFTSVLVISGGAYHIYQMLTGNWQLTYDFFMYQLRLMKTQDAGHGGSVFYHPLVLFIGVFPSSVLALNAFFRKSSVSNVFRRLMVVLFLVVLVIFSLVQTKIVHYSSLCYFPISYLAAVSVYDICYKRKSLSTLSKVLLSLAGFVYAIIPGLLQLITNSIPSELLKKFIADDFALACINSIVYWSGYEFILGLAFGLAMAISVFYLHGTKQVLSIYASTILFIFMFMFILIPKIEKYSQGAAIDFISAFKGKPVWVSALGYYSYAPYFYADKPKRACNEIDEQEFLLHGNTGCDVYFVTKITELQSIIDQNPQLVAVKQNGGFVLLKRIK